MKLSGKIKEALKSRRETRRENKMIENPNDFYKVTKGAREMNKQRSYDALSREYLDAVSNPKEVVLHSIDPVTLVLFVILTAFAFIVSLSATNSYADTFYDNKFYFVFQNVKFLAIGIILVFGAIYCTKYMRTFAIATIIAYPVTIALLILVLVAGTSAGGAQRWIEIAGISIQPSEIAKTTLVLIMAFFMSVNQEKIVNRKNKLRALMYGLVMPFLFIAVFCLFVYLEKHNSGMIILAAIGVCVMFIGGTNKKWLVLIAVVGAAALLGLVLITGHGVDRITSWWEMLFDSDVEINDANWQTTQGLYAISSGGLFGLGPGQSRLKYGYVSQPQNDFIYPIICEELGFVGGVAVIILFFAIFLRMMKLGTNANNMFVSIAICGLAMKLIIQVLLNIAVVTAIIPNTGISLPMFSAGGSAMVIQMLEFGIVLGLSRYCDVK
ncbi:MAG: FtsW/RodA/SpoVE family cell cycle protein [Clostridia bacterium]|nr:FtsW/RodA/SpoVE family cell cycle protein [Clostridia bacterium]